MRQRIILALVLILAACGAVEQQVDAPIAPTTVPLSGATPPPATTLPATIAPTASNIPVAPTKVIPPADTVSVPAGFGISVFQDGLKDPRMMTVGPDGALYVAERGAGQVVRLPDADADGVGDGAQVVATGLSRPSSLAFHSDGSLYVAETTRVLRLSNPDQNGAFQSQEVIIDGLPEGGHATRTIVFNADSSTLFVSIGSSCNNCVEEDERRAAVMAYNPDGSNGKLYTRGLRNAVGLAWRPGTEELWATNNGRDLLGDDQPPETVNVINAPDLDFGWPRCHSGRIVDPELGGAEGCTGVTAPVVEMQAHSAPLGLAFTKDTFPAPYAEGLFVAFHGSWNRSEPTGYKVVFVPLEDAKPGPVQDFATGWLKSDGVTWGRPADVIIGPNQSLYISDDFAGIIYRVFAVK